MKDRRIAAVSRSFLSGSISRFCMRKTLQHLLKQHKKKCRENRCDYGVKIGTFCDMECYLLTSNFVNKINKVQ